MTLLAWLRYIYYSIIEIVWKGFTMIGLDPRLQAISKMVIYGQPLADIGTDHALLPIYLVENQIIPGAIISDRADEPCRRAAAAVQGCSCPERIQIRQGNGLEVLQPGEVSTVVIAGLGGETIVQILSSNWIKSRTFTRYVFQPMSRAGILRKTLGEQGWPIREEVVVQNQQHFYTIISSVPDQIPYVLSPLQQDVGPLLLQDQSDIARAYKQYWLQKYYKLWRSLAHARGDSKHQETRLYEKMIKELEGIIDAGQS